MLFTILLVLAILKARFLISLLVSIIILLELVVAIRGARQVINIKIFLRLL